MHHYELLHQTHLTETDGKIILKCVLQKQGQGNTVGVATRYGLDGPGIEFWWGARFVYLSRPAIGPTQLPVQWVSGLFSGGQVAGGGVDHPPSLKPRLKKEYSYALAPPKDLHCRL
jgi:hypothetical protein